MRSLPFRHALAAFLLLALSGLPAPPLRAQVSAEAVEAAYLAKFGRYLTWPATARPAAGERVQLCLVGNDPFGRTIDRAAASETIAGRQLSVRRVSSARGAAGCHLAYIQGSTESETRALLNGMEGIAALTVTDGRWGSARGMIHFVLRDGRVRFYIDEAEAAGRGLAISSRLLALAIDVKRQRKP